MVAVRPPSETICLTFSFRSPFSLAAAEPLSSTIHVIAVRNIATAPFGAAALRQRTPSLYAPATSADSWIGVASPRYWPPEDALPTDLARLLLARAVMELVLDDDNAVLAAVALQHDDPLRRQSLVGAIPVGCVDTVLP